MAPIGPHIGLMKILPQPPVPEWFVDPEASCNWLARARLLVMWTTARSRPQPLRGYGCVSMRAARRAGENRRRVAATIAPRKKFQGNVKEGVNVL